MKKLFFILSMLPLWGFGGLFAAPVSVSVVPITANYAANPPTVTFQLSWLAGSRNDDNRSKVWVFVEYKKVKNNAYAGSWTRAGIAGTPTITASPSATASSVTGNTSGFFLQGPATGDFAATVTVPLTVDLTGHAPQFGWCAYAIDRPPHAEAKDGYYALHGTPPFTITTTGNGDKVSQTNPAYNATCIYGLTDATGCPGEIPFTPPEIIGFTASASSICAGQSITLTATTTGDAASYSFNNGKSWKTTNTTVRTPPVPGFIYTLLVQPSPGACTVSASTTHPVTVRPLPEPVFDNPPAAICANNAATLTASGAGSSGSYCFTYECTACVRNPYLTGNDEPAASDCYWYSECIYGEANTYTVAMPDAGSLTVWVRAMTEYGCVDSTSIAYSAFSAGSIATASATTTLGTASTAIIAGLAPASGGDGNITYEWRRSGTSDKVLLNSDSPDYTISSDATNYSIVGTHYFTRYAKDSACNTAFAASDGQFTLTVLPAGNNQLQGSCTFTQPPVVATFAAFPATYSASTFVTLMDERDNKNYTAVKIGDRWIMAQNLNYQKDLAFQANSNMPSTGTGQNTALIGHFWCPGGDGGSTATSTLASCNVWGALYSWETAMMVDGKWSDDNRNSTAWADVSYSTNTSSGNTNNGGKGAGSHGICPANWHVPTDAEWGDILNEMETGTKNHNTNTGWIGTNAGIRGKSDCTCASGITGSSCVDDVKANWHYSASHTGNDYYGFHVMPAGYRYSNGSFITIRGYYAYFWSSTADISQSVWYRGFNYGNRTVDRTPTNPSHGFSVRCVRD